MTRGYCTNCKKVTEHERRNTDLCCNECHFIAFTFHDQPSPAAGNERMCQWQETEEYWQTGCGREWVFTDSGTPADHGMKFCYHCGEKLLAAALSGGRS